MAHAREAGDRISTSQLTLPARLVGRLSSSFLHASGCYFSFYLVVWPPKDRPTRTDLPQERTIDFSIDIPFREQGTHEQLDVHLHDSARPHPRLPFESAASSRLLSLNALTLMDMPTPVDRAFPVKEQRHRLILLP